MRILFKKKIEYPQKTNTNVQNSAICLIVFSDAQRKLRELSESSFDSAVVFLSKVSNVSDTALVECIEENVKESVNDSYFKIDEELLICLIWHLGRTRGQVESK